ncbi:MAG TPA: RluA family pseudouridine synthase [Acholeplasmataceae bacterium]|nr:RluA family pseudouridine synthase [Acholeplasmataceae bacterium]
MVLKFLVEKESLVKEYILEKGVSRSLGRKIKLYGEIYINGNSAENWFPIKPGDVLEIFLSEKENPNIIPVAKPLEIVYEDKYLLIINKPANLSTQPSKKYVEDNLIGRIKHYYVTTGVNANIHIVTRLDYGTSGLVLVAKNAHLHHLLQTTAIEKVYLAEAEGHLPKKEGRITFPIKRLTGDRLRRTTASDGKASLTLYRVIKEYLETSLLELTIKTGRCHQIRVHLATLGHPVVGDKLYGKGAEILRLHAYRLHFKHPSTEKDIEVKKKTDWLNQAL